MSRTHAPPMTETGVPVSEPDEGQDLRDLSPHAGLELSPALRSHVLDPAVWQEHLETYAAPEQARPLASHEHERGRTTLAVSRRILVVDDERLSAVSWGKLLRTAGHEIRTAHDGFEALGVADAFRPDVVLLDIGLPKMNGYEVAQRIRQQPWGQGMVLIALTGWSQETDRHRSTAAGFDEFWDTGHLEFPAPDDPPVLFAGYRTDPQSNPLRTPSGRIELFSDTIAAFGYDDCPGHPVWLEPAEWLGSEQAKVYPLHLLSNQPRVRLHSQLDCGEISRSAKVAQRQPVWLNPDDAATRGITNGDVVRIYNDRGACLAGAVVTDAIRPGVIQLATGAWFDPLNPAEIGSLDKHGNPNVLTLDKGTSKLAQSPAAQTVLVEVERFTGTVPPITAFEPPRVIPR